MRLMTVISILVVLINPQIAVAKDNNLLGVWKNAKNRYSLDTIEFKKDGSYIVCNGGWVTVKGKKIQYVASIRYKIKNAESFTLNGDLANGFMTMKFRGRGAMKYKLKDGKLTISPFFEKPKSYERLNSKEFSTYNKTIKLFGNGVTQPDKTIQARVGDKTIIVKPEGKILAIMPLVYYEGILKKSPTIKTLYMEIKGEKVLASATDMSDAGMDFKVNTVITWDHQYVYPSTQATSMAARYPKYPSNNFMDIRNIKVKDTAMESKEDKVLSEGQKTEDLIVKKRKGRIIKHINSAVNSVSTVSEMEIEDRKIVVWYVNKQINEGDIVTWLWSDQKNRSRDYPNMYSLYDAKPYKGKLATIDPLKRAKIIEVFSSRKGAYAYRADLNGEMVWLLALDLQLAKKQLKPNDTIIWSRSMVKKDHLKRMVRRRMLPSSIMNSTNRNIRQLQIFDVVKMPD